MFPEVITLNEPDTTHIEDAEGSPDLTNTEGTHEQNVQDEQIITQSTKGPLRLILNMGQYEIKHIKLVNIIGDPGEGMLTRSMDAKLTAASTSECLFDDFLSKIELKKISEALKHPGWVDVMQEELNKFYRNKVWTLVLLLYALNGKKELTDKTFALVERMEAIKRFLAYATYMNFIVFQMDVKSAFLKLQIKQDDKGISICQEQYTRNLLKKYDVSDSSSVKTPMVPSNNLGRDLTVLCARYQSNPKESHLIAVKRILRYLKGTPSLSRWYLKCLGFDLKGYSDLDYAGCNMDRKSTSGAYQILGGKLVCWSAKKQQSVAMSSAEAEYIIGVGGHILKGDIELHFIPTEYQLADIFTKPLDEPTFTRQKAESLPQKRKKSKSKNTPTEAQVTPPLVPIEEPEKTQSVSSGQTAHPQDTKRQTQLAIKGIHSPLDEGTLTSKPLLEEVGKTQPPYKGTNTKDKDSKGLKPPPDMKPSPTLVSDTSRTDAKYQPESSHTHETDESNSDSSCPDVLKKYDNILPLTKRKLVKYLKNISQDAVKEDSALNKKVHETIEAYTKNSSSLTELFSLVKGFNFPSFKTTLEDLQATTLRQDEMLASWAKSSTSMA
ncbi:hypothetical protein Tco_0349634 [Tanacetum coccineum]